MICLYIILRGKPCYLTAHTFRASFTILDRKKRTYNFPIEFLIFKLISSVFALQLSFLCLCRLSFDSRKKCKTRGDYERDRAAKNNQQEKLQQVQQLSSSVLVEIVGHAICNVKENKVFLESFRIERSNYS